MLTFVQLGNEKMDTGLHYKTLDEELKNCPAFTSSKLVTLMIDLLVSREASWQKGTMLIQNILSCLQFELLVMSKIRIGMERSYFEELKRVFADVNSKESDIWSKVLDAYMIGLAKTTDLALSKFRNGIICPEEDVGMYEFGANFLEYIESKEVIAVLELATKWVRAQKKLKIFEKDEAAAASLGAVLDRLEFRIELIYIVNEKKQPKKSHITLALDLIEKILKSQVLDVDEKLFDCCFTSGIQSRVSNNNPLRSPQKVTIVEAYEIFKTIITTIEGYRPVQSIASATEMLSFFVSSATNQQTLPLARVFLQVITQVSNSTLLGQQILSWALEDMRETTGPNMMKFLSAPNGSYQVDNTVVLTQLAACYEDLLKANMVNRARQRQHLAHCIVSWDTLQVATEEFEDSLIDRAEQRGEPMESVVVDDGKGGKATIPALPISSWVYLRKIQIMIWVVLLGFELDIYKIWEYGYMYRYVEYLVRIQSGHLQRTLNYVEQALVNLATRRTPRESGKGNSRSTIDFNAANIKLFEASLDYLTGLAIEAEALHSLCSANMNLAEAAVLAGYAARPAETTSHTSPELLYGLRMKPFSSVGTPELPPYKDMVTTDLEETDDILSRIKGCLAEAKRASLTCRATIDQLGPAVAEANPELRKIKRSAVGIAVSCSQMESHAAKKFESHSPVTEQPRLIVERNQYHWYFPVLTFAPGAKK